MITDLITDRASAIQREVDQLIDLQIATLRDESPLTSDQLMDYHLRFEIIQELYRELDQINRTRLVLKL